MSRQWNGPVVSNSIQLHKFVEMIDARCDDCLYTYDSDLLDNESETCKERSIVVSSAEEHSTFTVLLHIASSHCEEQ